MTAALDNEVAELRRANAELQQRLDEALARESATGEVLSVINASPGDLAPVFEAMLEKAVRLCEATFGILWDYDGDSFHAAAMHGVPIPFAEYLREPLRPGPGTSLARMIAGEPLNHVVDVTVDEAYRAGDPGRRALADLGGARTALTCALRKDDKLLGVFQVYRNTVQSFAAKQIALLQSFAAQAVIAMENARLITETREALDQQTATAEVLGVINASPGDLAPVFDAILEKAMALCSAATGVMTVREGEQFRTIAARGVPTAFVEFRKQNPVPPGASGIAGRIRSGEPFVHIVDLKDDDLYRSGQPQRRAMVDLAGARTWLAVGLKKDEDVLGAVDIFRREVRPFSDKEIALVQNFAAQAVIAIENARLITETREALEQQTATAEVLGVINASPGDLAPVFDAMLERAVRLCEFDFSTLWTFDGNSFRVVARHGLTEQFWQYLQDHTPPVFARIIGGERLVNLPDLQQVSAYMQSDFVLALRERGLNIPRSLLIVSLCKDDGAVLGVIVAYRLEVRPFSDKQIALLQNFAAQAVIAMENARLLGELRQRTDEVAELNRGLEARVAEQVDELGRVGRLKRFLAPQLAELIVSQGDEKILESHRREIVVVFCDLRGYTAFTETAEPEEVLDFLREYHGAMGPLVAEFEGTLDQFSGDGIMVFFNDPVPIPDPAERAVKMAMAMREAAGTLIADWRERGRDLGFGAGIAQGYATLGQIGFAERAGYTAIGTVCNVAARLCAEAKDGQILLSQRVNVALKGSVPTVQFGALALKGLTQPVMTYNVPLAPIQPALRVIEGGPQTV